MTEKNSDRPRVGWEVPITWLIGGLGVICIQAAVVYFGQVRQGEILQEQSLTIRELSKQLGHLSQLITSTNVKDVEHDMKLNEHERRITALESRQK